MGLLFLAAAGGGASAAQAPRLAALRAVAPGQWLLKEKGGESRSLCVADPRALMQIEHGPAQCTRFIVADTPRSATVHYTCPGAGHGRSTISVEGKEQFRLETQGILDGAPFDTEYEGHRVGQCGAASSAR
ncbi:DUF3617 domain-containing protein [Sphingomonas sp. PB4P5]|uniref:DUF3617 domain-containing protein n=1 Tax=Parasphingomonas puruogangriensis TaxID=3096155 RepID=UPI002FC853DC